MADGGIGGVWAGRVEGWAAKRWVRRCQEAIELLPTLDVMRSIEIAGSPDEVWDLVHPAESATALIDGVVGGFTMPGSTPGRVGERQCFVIQTEDGKLESHVFEVVELDPGHRSVTVPVPDNGLRMTTTVAGDQMRSILTVRTTCKVLPERSESAKSLLEVQFDRYLTRVRDQIEAGRTHPLP